MTHWCLGKCENLKSDCCYCCCLVFSAPWRSVVGSTCRSFVKYEKTTSSSVRILGLYFTFDEMIKGKQLTNEIKDTAHSESPKGAKFRIKT